MEDDCTLLPTPLDKNRLEALDACKEGRVESENCMWVVLKYNAGPAKAADPRWQPYSLIVNAPGVPAMAGPCEFKNLRALLAYLDQLESKRKK